MNVALAYLHPGHVQHAFMASVIRTMRAHPDLTIWPLRTGPNSIPDSRNRAAEMLIESDLEWLWFADTDVGFGPDMLGNLLAIADEHERPVVAAPVLAVVDGEPDGLGGFVPQIHPAVYEWTGFQQVTSVPLPENQLIQVGACGAAMMLIHRSVLEKIQPKPFQLMGVMGEDLSFCRRLLDHDIPLHVHTGLRTSHTKSIPLT